MHLYRMAYKPPYSETRRRATFVADCPLRALWFAGGYCQAIKAELLCVIQEREAEVNSELELAP